MNLEVEREEGELAKLRRLRDRVMALPRYIISTDENGDPMPLEVSEGEYPMVMRLVSADDIDAALKEVGSG